jgi:F0F1-type ATP synthase membrane subunit c/vacuolar-type H+-ATPase subunit K
MAKDKLTWRFNLTYWGLALIASTSPHLQPYGLPIDASLTGASLIGETAFAYVAAAIVIGISALFAAYVGGRIAKWALGTNVDPDADLFTPAINTLFAVALWSIFIR